MPKVILGNAAPIEPVKHDPDSIEAERVQKPDVGFTETHWSVPEEWEFDNQLRTVVSDTKSHHSDKIIWVESDDEDLANAVARSFNVPVGRPDDWDEKRGTPSEYAEDSSADAEAVKLVPSEVSDDQG